MPGSDEDLDDLLSSLDEDAASRRGPGRNNPAATISGFDDDEEEDSRPAIRTPLPPKPLPSENPIMFPATFGPSMPAKTEAKPSDLSATEVEEVSADDQIKAGPPITLPPPHDDVDALATASLAPLHLAEPDAVGSVAPLKGSVVAADPSRAFEMIETASAKSEALAAQRADADLGASLAPRQGLPSIIWVGLLSFAVAVLGSVIYSSIDAFHPERAQTEELLAEREKRIAEGAAGRRASVSGTISVESEVSDAAVWFLLGRTPVESIALPSDQVHNLRVELDGQKTTFATVDRTHWSGNKSAQVARLRVKLPKASSVAEAVPAYAPEPAVRPPPGPSGKGRLIIESDPPGARVWLLIGFTPEVPIRKLEVGHRYELAVRKDGYRPGFTEVRASDWLFEGTEARRKVDLPPITN